MKRVWCLLGVVALVSGCAVGTEDPTGDTNLGTVQAGTVGSDDSTSEQGPAQTDTQAGTTREHRDVFDVTGSIIPPRPGRGPTSPDPGPVHGPVAPR